VPEAQSYLQVSISVELESLRGFELINMLRNSYSAYIIIPYQTPDYQSGAGRNSFVTVSVLISSYFLMTDYPTVA